MYWFSVAFVTNYHKRNLVALNNINVLSYCSVGQKFNTGITGLKSECVTGRAVLLSGGSMEEYLLAFSNF